MYKNDNIVFTARERSKGQRLMSSEMDNIRLSFAMIMHYFSLSTEREPVPPLNFNEWWGFLNLEDYEVFKRRGVIFWCYESRRVKGSVNHMLVIRPTHPHSDRCHIARTSCNLIHWADNSHSSFTLAGGVWAFVFHRPLRPEIDWAWWAAGLEPLTTLACE